MDWPAKTAVISATALIVASLLDPGHELLAHYVSWLSDGPMAWLAGVAVLGMGAAAAGAGWQLRKIVGGAWGDAMLAALACSALLSVAVVIWPSRGYGEPLWYTARHVGLAVGAYTGIVLASAAAAWMQYKGRVRGAPMLASFMVLQGALAALLVASAAVRVFASDVDVRGLMQFLLVAAAAWWMVAAGRLEAAGQPARATTMRPGQA